MTNRCLVAVAMLAACEPAERPQSGAAGPQAPASVSAADFRTIGWIEGTWRGTGGGVEPFFERYQLIDDSTLLRLTFSDSSLSAVSDSARIVLRGGRVVEPGDDPQWQVTAFDSTSWRFESMEGAGRAFTWRREARDRWTAVLESREAAGTSQERVYILERHSR